MASGDEEQGPGVAPGTTTRDGPRERLARVGPERLGDAELLAVLLGTGARGEPVGVLAARLLEEAGGLAGLERTGVGALSGLPGIGRSKAARVVAALEIGRRVATSAPSRGARIGSSRDVDALLRPRLAREASEPVIALPLDAKNRPLGELRIAIGGLTACPVAPSDVFRALVREAAAAVIFAHNHPSGEPSPSPEDLALTERLCRAGELLGVRVVDHGILGHEGYFSFLDAGLLEARGRDK